MDTHKQLSQMDPKLKEAYERVMDGTSTQPMQPPQTPQSNGITHTGDLAANTSAQPILQTVEITTPQNQIQPPAIHTGLPQEAVTSEKVPVTNPHPATQTFVAPSAQPHTATGTVHIGYGVKPGQKVNIEKKKLNIPPALYIVGCVAFFILYTFFWIKVFNIPLPFLP